MANQPEQSSITNLDRFAGRMLRIVSGVSFGWFLILFLISTAKVAFCRPNSDCVISVLRDLLYFGILLPAFLVLQTALWRLYVKHRAVKSAPHGKDDAGTRSTNGLVVWAARCLWLAWVAINLGARIKLGLACSQGNLPITPEQGACVLNQGIKLLLWGILSPAPIYWGITTFSGSLQATREATSRLIEHPAEPTKLSGKEAAIPIEISDRQHERGVSLALLVELIGLRVWLAWALLYAAASLVPDWITCKDVEHTLHPTHSLNCGVIHASMWIWIAGIWPGAGIVTIRSILRWRILQKMDESRFVAWLGRIEGEWRFWWLGRASGMLVLFLGISLIIRSWDSSLLVRSPVDRDLTGVWSIRSNGGLVQNGVLKVSQNNGVLLGFGGTSLADPEPDTYVGRITGDEIRLWITYGLRLCPAKVRLRGRIRSERFQVEGGGWACLFPLDVSFEAVRAEIPESASPDS